MTGKFGYAIRETLANLRRNLMLTTASVLTVAVSLALVGAVFLLRSGVDNATQRWESGIEFEVFLNADHTPAQAERVERVLEASPDVAKHSYVSQEEQYEFFKTFYADQPVVLREVEVEHLPPSYQVTPAVADVDVIQALGDRLEQEAGVYRVVFPQEEVRTLLRVSNVLQAVIFGVAAVLLFSASLLIFNTIRMAIFARRWEIEVMKLVGATNWFIRVPFMIEGLVQGLLGALVALTVVSLGRGAAESAIRSVDIFDGFVVLSNQLVTTGVLTLLIGAVIGTVGAGVALSKFLDV